MTKPSCPKDYRGVIAFYRNLPEDISKCFPRVDELIENYDLQIALAFLFSKIEMFQNMALYCGATKLHQTESDITKKAVNDQHITRDTFKQFFELIYGFKIPSDIQGLIQEAQLVRDKLMHGKKTGPQEHRLAIVCALKYCEMLDNLVYKKVKMHIFTPDLRGFKGRKIPLSKKTSRFVLKGLGFNLA